MLGGLDLHDMSTSDLTTYFGGNAHTAGDEDQRRTATIEGIPVMTRQNDLRVVIGIPE